MEKVQGRNPRRQESVLSQIDSIDRSIAEHLDNEALQSLLPPGAARNAVDCALWDYRAKQTGNPVHTLLDLPAPGPVTTAYTLSLDTPQNMLESAKSNAARPLLKMKLAGEGDPDRVKAVRKGAPDSRLIVDANEAWTIDIYRQMVPQLVDLNVEMIEQPFPAGEDSALANLDRPIAICADESCHDRQSLASLRGLYDIINIKLDKTGGLTEALALKKTAESMDFDIMVGCMVATSLAMAPAILVAQEVAYVDLDGPLLLAEDRDTPLVYEGSTVHPAKPELWG